MRHLDPVRTDFLVIGGGAAEMLVANYLSERRRDVALVDTGTSSTALSTGCFNGTAVNEDMLDYLVPRLMANGLSMTRLGSRCSCWATPVTGTVAGSPPSTPRWAPWNRCSSPGWQWSALREVGCGPGAHLLAPETGCRPRGGAGAHTQQGKDVAECPVRRPAAGGCRLGHAAATVPAS